MNIKKSLLCCFVISIFVCFPVITIFADPTTSVVVPPNSQSSSSSSVNSSSSTNSTPSKSNSESSGISSGSKTTLNSNSSQSSSNYVSSPADSVASHASPPQQNNLPSSNIVDAESPAEPQSNIQKNSTLKTKASFDPSSLNFPKPFLWTESSVLPESDDSQEDISNEPEKPKIDLPEIDSSEYVLPEVIASNTDNNKDNFISGIIAWLCIATGVVIVLFVIFNGKHKGEISLNTVTKNKKSIRKSKHLLSNKYYKNKY